MKASATPFDRRYQVFVSSTYDDLIEERKLIYEALLETYCIPVGMELFPAAPEKKWEMICRLIDDCDYFIVIVAGKYGTPAPDGMGWTEKEFDYARERSRKPIGFFYDDIDRLPGGKLEGTDAGRARLIAFTQKLREGSCKPWKDAAGLASAVKTAIVHAILHEPMPGWVRASSPAGPAELKRLPATQSGSRKFVLSDELISIRMLLSSRNSPVLPVEFPFPIREAFAAIASKLTGDKPKSSLARALMDATAAERELAAKDHLDGRQVFVHWSFETLFLDRLLKTFEGSDLIRQVPPPKYSNRRSWYWRLTGTGRVELARLQSLI